MVNANSRKLKSFGDLMLKKIIKIFLICLNFNSLFSSEFDSEIRLNLKNYSGINTKLLLKYQCGRIGEENREKAFDAGQTLRLSKSWGTATILKFISAFSPICDDPNSKASFDLNQFKENMTLYLIVEDGKLQFLDSRKKTWKQILESIKKPSTGEFINKELQPDG